MAKNKKKSSGKGSSLNLNLMLIFQLIVMLILSVFITVLISNKTRENSKQHLGAITDERAQIIETYVSNAENTLRDFSKAQQITDLLKFANSTGFDFKTLLPDKGARAEVPATAAEGSDEEKLITADKLQKAAQDFTVQFGNDIPYLEGVWVGTWDTLVLTHTNGDPVIGMTTRPDRDKLGQLQSALVNGDRGLWNAGIIISPATQKQIISMYIAVYNENNEPIGLVGLGIFTEGLVQTLDAVPVRGIENSFYSMVNIKDGKYIFSRDANTIGTEADNENIVRLCEQFKQSADNSTGEFEYKFDGKTYVSSYSLIPKYGWIVFLDDYKSEVFALTTTMFIYLSIFGFVILSLIVIFNIMSKRQAKINEKLVSTIAKNNLTKKSLNQAMFTDVLTNVNNRIRFSMDVETASGDRSKNYYFMLFNIADFSGINSQFGNDSGDLMLVRTVNILKESFPESGIYRTGSDEFVIMLPAEGEMTSSDAVIDKVNTVLRQLVVPESVERYGTIYPKYKIAVIKKSGTIDTSVVTVLKDMTNRTGEASYGMIDYQDLT
ncbi:MAG: diguanylate cyclase [Ruminococcus sp.]|nr:diguanylate cyclase [Ruminococcus sp.]